MNGCRHTHTPRSMIAFVTPGRGTRRSATALVLTHSKAPSMKSVLTVAVCCAIASNVPLTMG